MNPLVVADESVDSAIVALLRSAGYQVIYITELNPGWPDTQVLEFAFAQGAYLLTEDKDFGELTFRLRKPSYGILLIRMPDASSLDKASWVLTTLERHLPDMWGAFSVLEDNKIRIKKIF
jgi:predicted nuclease of predicted toxin-antitoxin system